MLGDSLAAATDKLEKLPRKSVKADSAWPPRSHKADSRAAHVHDYHAACIAILWLSCVSTRDTKERENGVFHELICVTS